MANAPLYHFKKTYKQQAKIFRNMAVMSLIYLIAIYGYDHYAPDTIPEDLLFWTTLIFPIAAIILFGITIKMNRSKGVYRASVTQDQVIIDYPSSDHWSFEIDIKDIKRFEQRQPHGPGGKGILSVGILLHDGQYKEIGVNFGVNVKAMFKAVQSIKPDVTYSKSINKSFWDLRKYKD